VELTLRTGESITLHTVGVTRAMLAESLLPGAYRGDVRLLFARIVPAQMAGYFTTYIDSTVVLPVGTISIGQ
jgi:hypothetical protein